MSFPRSNRARAWVSAALALGVCACATAPRYPINPAPPPPAPVEAPAPPPPPPPPPVDPDAPKAAPSTPVQATPLPPIGQSGAPPAAPASAGSARVAVPAAAPSFALPRPARDEATAEPPPGVSPWAQPPAPTDIPGQTIVGRGETLFDVAERVRTPVRAIIEVNNLQPPYNLAPGTVLKIPPPLFYSVGAGDTLFGIARRFNIDPRSLANLNTMQLETGIHPGQRIALPSLARDQGPNPQAGGVSPPGSAVASASPPPAPRPNRPPAPPMGAAASAVASAASSGSPGAAPGAVVAAAASANQAPPADASSDAQVAAAGKGRFSWPIQGDVISTYGPKGPGQRNDGLNIAAQVGQPVRSAAGGEVVFAGELPSFGNLVLLKHPGGFVTAYAHLSKIEVKMRETVTQGQELGLVGQTGMVDRPQLHFEVRYAENPRDKAKPVDPSLLLPAAG